MGLFDLQKKEILEEVHLFTHSDRIYREKREYFSIMNATLSL